MKFVVDRDKTAIIYRKKEISYKEMIIKSKSLKEYANLQKDSKAIIFMENRPEFLYSFLSIWDSEAVSICLDFTSTVKELEYYIEDSDTETIFTSVACKEKVYSALKNLGKTIEVIIVDEVTYKETYEGELVLNSPAKESVSLILYTSGTTGKPKGVMITYDNILLNIEALDKYNMYMETDIVLGFLPLHHILPLLGTGIIPLYKGATIVFLKEISAVEMIEAFQVYKVTIMVGVPRVFILLHGKIMEKIKSSFITRTLFKLCEKVNNEKFSRIIFKKVSDNFGGKLRFFVSGGSKLDEQVTKDFKNLGIRICEGYGMTETSPMVSFTPYENIIPGSAGRIIDGVEVKISDDGEILARGRNVMKGYYKRPKETAETIDKDGWIHTGDLGEVKDNYIYVTGRKKEMIVLPSGKNINPVEIEEWIRTNTELVEEVVVSDINSVLTAVIYPNFEKIKEKEISNIKETIKFDVVDKYNKEAADYKKVLDVIIVQDELPKTKIGKVRRFMIADLVSGNIEEREDVEEPEIEEYAILKEYISNVKERKIYPDSHIELDLAMDSLDIVELLYFIENKFGIKTDENTIAAYPTVEKLSFYINKNRNSEELGDGISWSELLKEETKLEIPKSHIFVTIGKFLMRIIFNTYFRVKITNKDKLNEERTIYVGNHQSYLDAFVLNYSIPNKILKETYYLAKVSHFNKSYMKFLANRSNIIILDINKNLSDVLKTMAALLRKGKNVVIFPEGTRTRNGEMTDFKKSFAILAKELDVKVQPFAIKGAYDLFPPHAKFPKSGRLEIKFFDKIEPKDLSYEEIVDKSRETIREWIEDNK